MPAIDDAMLTELRVQAAEMLTDFCTLRRNLSQGPAGTGALDGRGGYSDSRGGETDTWKEDGPYPCRLQAMPVMRGETMSGDKPTQRSRYVLVLPWDTNVGNTDEVVTAAGNYDAAGNPLHRTLEVLDTGGRTDGLTRRVSVMEVR